MGVTSLWTIVQPCARPTPLPTLNRKRLAVDASIWIYQFLKAVRDKEGNALRNSHVVGFFRRICKLIFFGIKPVFVFDGGAPVVKRQTVLSRKKRREGRREDAVRTAGRLLAVQMQRRGEEEVEKQKKDKERGIQREDTTEEPLPEEFVYVDEIGMSAQERQTKRNFRKQDAYHLPDLTSGIEGMGQPNDPRIMSHEELEEYARQFHNGEDINLYDFSKIDFNGEFFMSLPAVDRYNILNAARLRSRLRMGLSKQQLEEMFPDRMAFSRFQIERVTERNELTQRLMNLNGMNGIDVNGGGRIAGEKGREYVLVKNEGVEGGWALGVVSSDKSVGERSKPIDVDALSQQIKGNQDDEESEEDFEDVPVEGLNRLPKLTGNQANNPTYKDFQAREVEDQRRKHSESRRKSDVPVENDSLFVDDDGMPAPSFTDGVHDEEEDDLQRAIALSMQQDDSNENQQHDKAVAFSLQEGQGQEPESDEEDHLSRAIALSLQKQHEQEPEPVEEEEDFEDVPMPEYEQRIVEAPKPIANTSGKMVAHIVNNRASAAVPKHRAVSVVSGSDSDEDFQSALAKARKEKAPEKKRQPAPVAANLKSPFDGPLPFEKLDFGSSIFGKKRIEAEKSREGHEEGEGEDMAGGFVNGLEEEQARPLPPWLVGNDDIRTQVKEQQQRDVELNAEDRERAVEEDRIFQRDHGVIEIESSDEGSDVEVLDEAPPPKMGEIAEDVRAVPVQTEIPSNRQPSIEPVASKADQVGSRQSDEEVVDWSESEYGDAVMKPGKTLDSQDQAAATMDQEPSKSKSPSPMIQNDESPQQIDGDRHDSAQRQSPSPVFEDVDMPDSTATFPSEVPPSLPREDTFDRQQEDYIDFDDFSDPEEEELLAQLAVEAEEHARFASTLNNKSERENQEAYEKELKALRSQQKRDLRDADEVSHIMITECQALLRLFGLPYITAPMEAEAQCAELVKLGLVDGIVTDDSDIFLFGGTRVYKNVFNSNKFVECYLSSEIEKELSLTRDHLISIAHLLGSDYTEGLPGIGPVTAVEIISEFSSPTTGLQDFATWWSNVQLHASEPVSKESSTFCKKFRRSQATKLFLPPAFPVPAVTEAYLKPDVDNTPDPFQWGVPDLDALRDFLMATIGWSQERTDEVLVPVIKDMNRRGMEGTQSNITRYFEGGVGAGARTGGNERNGGSKRMKKAVGRLKAGKNKALSERPSFTDMTSEWVKKNDAREERRKKKEANGKATGGRGRKRKAAEVPADDETQDNQRVGDDDEGRSSSREASRTIKRKRAGNGKSKREEAA